MKKLLYCAAALAMTLFAGSCQKENLEPEDGNIVTYTVQVPDALSTKAIGTNVSAVNELVYEVYRFDYENNEEDRLYQKTLTRDANNGENSWTVELELVNNQDFRVLFWAQVPGNGVYNTDNLTAVTLSTNLNANAENYAAFAGQTEIKYNKGFKDGNITLVRPVAQLNIATSAESLVLGEGGSVTTTVTFDETSVEVIGLSNVYNVAAEEAVADNDGKTFSYIATDPKDLSEQTIEVKSEVYNYVSMNYVGFIPKAGDNVDVKYTIVTYNVGTITNEIKNVPVKANYRTNIIGNLITSTSDYTVELSNKWPAEDYKNIEVVSVSTAADLQQAIYEIPAGVEGNIKLEGHIDLSTLAGLVSTKSTVPTYGLLIPYGKSLVLDLNGNTLSQTVNQTGGYSMIQNDGVLTIIDGKGTGKISYKDEGNGGNYVSNTIINRGTLTVKGGTIENITPDEAANIGFAYTIDTSIWGEASAVLVNIEGGTIKSIYSPLRLRADSVNEEVVANISGGEICGRIDHQMSSSTAGVKATLNITGGTFNQHGIKDHSIMVFGAGETSDASGIVLNITGGDFRAPILIYRGEGVALGQNFNEKFITGGTFSFDPSDNVVDGYEVVKNGDVWTIGDFIPVAKIGDKEYGSIQSAVDAVRDGETITVLDNLTDVDCFYNRTASFTLDLNNKTLQSSNHTHMFEFNWNKVADSTPVTINITNGTLLSGDNTMWTIYSEDTNNVKGIFNLTNLTIEHNMPNYGAVVAGIGNTFNAENVDITTSYGIGFYAAGGEVVLEDCCAAVEGLHEKPYNSMAFAVCANGKMTINSGEYSATPVAETDANNQGTSHGSWCGGIMSSGGELIINGGRFSNDNFGDSSLATYARSCIMVDAGGHLQINGGTFNALNKIIYLINNIGNPALNPTAQVTGGIFSKDPTNNDGYGEVEIPDGYIVVEKNGVFEVLQGTAVSTAEELIEALKAVTANSTIYLTSDITVTEKWDNRYTGGKTSVPVTIDGLGHTLKFTGSIDDAANRGAVFYFTQDASVKDITIDVSNATHNFLVRAITAAGNLTLENCTFIGSLNHTRNNAVVVGDCGDSTLMWPYEVSITNCIFSNWRRGISDNENGKSEIKTLTIQMNKFNNSPVNVSAHENITFCNNETDSDVRLTSYTNAANTKVKAIGNTLNTSKINWIGAGTKYFSRQNVEAQSEFSVTTLD